LVQLSLKLQKEPQKNPPPKKKEKTRKREILGVPKTRVGYIETLLARHLLPRYLDIAWPSLFMMAADDASSKLYRHSFINVILVAWMKLL
jgi:hypothetical protein